MTFRYPFFSQNNDSFFEQKNLGYSVSRLFSAQNWKKFKLKTYETTTDNISLYWFVSIRTEMQIRKDMLDIDQSLV